MADQGNQDKVLYGVMAEFENPDDILKAAEKAHEMGYRKMDAYTPFPVEHLSETLGFRRARLPLIVFIGGLIGALTGFFLQYYASVISYPINVAGRPLNSWPSFIPITFELMVLFAAFSAILGMFALDGLPMPYHPVFNIERFEHASRDGFFLCIEAKDPKYNLRNTRQFLESLSPKAVYDVEP